MSPIQRRRVRIVAVVGAAALALPVAWFLGRGDASAVDVAEDGAAILPVETRTVRALGEYGVREEYAGRVTTRRKSQLGFERGGRLARLVVDEGDRVAAGDPMAELDSRELTARRRELAAQVRETRARLDLAKRTTGRQRQLRASDHTSEARLDEAVFAEQALEARLEAARAALASVEVALELSRIEAPYAGIVTARRADEGTVVAPGEAILELIEDGAMEARIGMPPETAAGLDEGARYDLEIAGRSVAARLQATLPSLEPDTRSVTAIFRLPEDAPPVADGSLARVSVEREVAAEGFWLPITALAESRRGLWSAYVVASSDDDFARVDRRQLEILHAEADRAFVRGTLRDGERVVASGVHRLVPGQRVRVVANATLALQ